MLYRGIQYDIKLGISRNEWIWLIHTPKPRQGVVIGSRNRAIFYAEKAINAWCARNPKECEARPTAA